MVIVANCEPVSKKKRMIIKCRGVVVGAVESLCDHSTVLNSTCVACKKCGIDGGFAFDYIMPGLRYSQDEVLRLKKRNTKRLLRKRKLHLVLDLDHTLLHSQKIKSPALKGEYLKKHQGDSCLFPLEADGYLTKLRPFVRTFLEEASDLFEMSVCTMGTRGYAEEVAKILDPESKYFSFRIISREDFGQREKKNLNLVLGEESSIVILDDTESVWANYPENLITVSRYDYFRDGEDDESEGNGALSNILRVLRTVHALYFDNPTWRDVRGLMAVARGWVLRGCRLHFRADAGESEHPSGWCRAEEMGATCTTVMDSSVTHMVSVHIEDVIRAEQEVKFLVHPRWIDDAYFLWSKPPEVEYLP